MTKLPNLCSEIDKELNQKFDDLRLGAIGNIELMIELLDDNSDILKDQWDTETLKDKLNSQLNILNKEI